MNDPDVSVVMAAFNAAETIEAAIASALTQKDVTIEVIVIDDCSNDDTCARVAALANRDPRILLLRQPCNAGPGAARNRGLAVARGRWIEILDADDLLAPERTERLINLASRSGSEIVADNVERFLDQKPDVAWPLLSRDEGDRILDVDLAGYLMANRMTAGETTLGYLKPVFSRVFLQTHGIVYDESLRIGEDSNIVLRVLAAGAKFKITTEPFYRYRVVAGSLSRTLHSDDLDRILIAHDKALANGLSEPKVRAADRAYRRSVADLLLFSRFRLALRKKDWILITWLATKPRLWLTLMRMLNNLRHKQPWKRTGRGAKHLDRGFESTGHVPKTRS